MRGLLTIGEFSRASYLSVKALRHYDDVDLLRPVEVDPATGYRFYAAAQLPAAQLIRRLRDLEMPIDQVRRVVQANDPREPDEAIRAHLEQMERRLQDTQDAVASLRAILTRDDAGGAIEYRTIGPETVVAFSAEVAWDDTEEWLASAFAHLHRDIEPAGPDGALYSEAFFEEHVGEVTAFVPVLDGPDRLVATRYAVLLHTGPFADVDRAYGALGAHVAERSIGVTGPIRENYLAEGTEVCWPITA